MTEAAGRPKKYDLRDLFQQALNLELGDSIVIPCRDFLETERTRNAFYRELYKMRKISPELAEEIRIRRIIKDDYHAVSVSKVQLEVTKAFLLTKEGKVKQIQRVTDNELDRIEKLMKEDGYSDEEIKAYKVSQVKAIPEIGEEDET